MRIAKMLLGATLAFYVPSVTHAQNARAIKIGVLNDQSGPYADMGGPGSVIAAQLAVEDSGLRAAGWRVEVISADHQNKADIAAGTARKWYDVEGVDMITDLTNSAAALA